MSLKIDRVQLEIEVRNDQSRMKMRELEKETKQLRKELKKLPEDSEEFRRKSKRLKEVQTQYDQITEKIGLAGLSMKELRGRQRELNAIIQNMDPRSENYKRLNKQLNDVNGRMRELRGGAKRTKLSLKGMADGFNRYFGMITMGIATFTGMAIGIGNMIQGSGELSDALTDVEKTTNMTTEEVRELNQQLMAIDTRTSRRELLELGRIAGKLGITGVSNVKGFVRAADQLVVALAEDLGGQAEESIRQVGKIVDIFDVKAEFGMEQGLLKVGSAINELGASSTANEKYLVEFSKRMGGLAPNANISAADIIGLGGTLDQLGQTSEIATTTLGKLFVLMGRDVPKFAEIAGMGVQDFSDLLANDANEAMIKVFEGAQSTKQGMEGLAASLETLGVDGQRSVQIVGTLSNNIDTLREQQELSNRAFDEGTSLTEEFEKKNNNLAATLAKIRKRLYSVFVNGDIMQGLTNIVNKFYEWIEVPIEEKLKKEQQEVNKLTIELTDANTKEAERKEILDKLAGISNTIVEGLDAENIITEKLKNNLAEYNEENMKKIMMDNLDEKKISQLKDINSLEEKRAWYMEHINRAMLNQNKDIALGNYSLEQKINSTEKLLKLEIDRLEAQEDLEKDESGSVSMTTTQERKINDLNLQLNSITKYRELSKRIEGSQGVLGEIESQKEQLRKVLNVKKEINKEEKEEENNERKKKEETEEEATETLKWHRELEEKKLELMEDSLAKKIALEQLRYERYVDTIEAEVADTKLKHQLIETAEREHHKKLLDIMPSKEEMIKEADKAIEEGIKYIQDNNLMDEASVTDPVDTAKVVGDTPSNNPEDYPFLQKIFGSDEILDQFIQKIEESMGESSEIVLQAMDTIVAAAGPAMDTYNAFVDYRMSKEEKAHNQNMEALERERESLEQKYEKGLISQTQYNNKSMQLDDKMQDQKKKFAIEQAKQQKQNNYLKAVTDAAAAITDIWANHAANPVIAGILTAMATAATGLQIAAIKSTPITGYASGYYPMQTQDGTYNTVFGGDPYTQTVSKPTHFVAGEQGANFPELIVDGPTFNYARANFPEAIDAIYQSRARAHGFADGYYPGWQNNTSTTQTEQNNERMIALLQAIYEENRKPTRAYVSYTDMEEANNEVRDIQQEVSG